MSRSFNVAVVGATGAVGEAMIDILHSREFPIANLYLLSSERSAGKRLAFGNKNIVVQRLDEFDFEQAQIALFSAGGSVSAEYAPKAAAAGCVVIDNTSHFRYDEDIPLVVPEVNPEAVAQYSQRNIIANPNCSTIQMMVALKPLHDAYRITKINVATYQAVSGAGQSAIKELAKQTADLLNAQEPVSSVFPKQIAFNAIPQIDKFLDNGFTKEEMKMVWETHKILNDETIQVNPTAVRIPVFYGHSEAIHIETEKDIELTEAKALLEKAPGVTVISENSDGQYATAVTDAAQDDAVFVSRLRANLNQANGINCWVASDNVRKGAALNSVQIAELLVKSYL